MEKTQRILDLWLEMMWAELKELTHVPVVSQVVPGITSAAIAYRSQLSLEGPIQGVIHVTASASSLVQLSQLAAGEPINSQAACTEEALEVWQSWLTGASRRLATRLSEDMGNVSENPCLILLQRTTAVDGMASGSAADTADSEGPIQQWILQVGGIEFSLSVRAQLMFPGDDRAGDAEQLQQHQPELEQLYAEQTIPDPAETELQASSLAQPGGARHEAAAPRLESHQTAKPVENHSRIEAPPDPRKVDEAPPPDPNSFNEPLSKLRLDLLLDIELEATLRFGALELPLREVLELGPGDVLPLDRHVREPVELVVGDRIVAKGEVVLVGGNFALHVTEVAEPRRRLETIRCLF
jgi:flagellar motor switch protein FliN/FliY